MGNTSISHFCSCRLLFVCVVLLFIGCQSTPVSIRTPDQARDVLVSSPLFKNIKQQVSDAANVRVVLESTSESGFEFWIYEDHPTHAVTIEHLKVDDAGRLFVWNVDTGEWN